jgi:ankyrin repeat protein
MDKITELFTLLNENNINKFKKILEDDKDNLIDMNMKDNNGNYFLNYAIIYNNLDLVNLLLKKEANIDIVDAEERSILYYPIKMNFIKIVKTLLEHNKTNIGISITDIRDKNGNTPLHYAIILKNEILVNLLLEYNSNLHIQDKNGNNALHLSLYSRNDNIILKILDSAITINDKNNSGETALHIACNLELVNIVEKLIKYPNININSQDRDNQLTPLYYAINIFNLEIIKLLVKQGADINLQDAYGNTVLHYICNYNKYEYYNEIIKLSKITINCNLWNLDGNIPLHFLLLNYNFDSNEFDEFIGKLIIDSNLNIQNSNGNTCLHLLCAIDIWKKYINLLVEKKLDISIKNKVNNRPIDIIKEKDKDKFINLIIDSYINRLKKNKKKEWYHEWENICKYELHEVSEKEIKQLYKIKKKGDFDNTCRDIIKENIYKTLEDSSKCTLKSFPRVKGYICPIIGTTGDNIGVCTFTGSTLDILFGLIHLLKKHKNACSTVNKNFRENKELCRFYSSMGININSHCEFLNFEIIWVYNKLYIAPEFGEYFNRCINNSNIRFIIIPIGIEMREGSHSNYLIYDKKIKEIERFEPHGSSNPMGLDYNPSLLDNLLEKRFGELIKNITYIRPSVYLPKIGFQLFDIAETKKKKIGDPGGFCALWSIWYVDMRILYSDIPRDKIVNILLQAIKEKNLSFRELIRNYSIDIIKIRDLVLNKNGLDINDWLMEQITDEQMNSIITDIIGEINKLT